METKKLNIFVTIAMLVFVFVPVFSFAEDTMVKNAGFAPGNIWFSQNDFTPGSTVKVYTILWNGGKDTITGEVVFYDNASVVGKVAFSLSSLGTKIASADWKVTDGYHKVYAVVGTSKIGTSGATLEYAKTDESEHFIGAPIKSTSPTTTAQQIVNEKVNFAKEYAVENLPTPITETTQSFFGKVEPMRTSVKTWTDSTSANVRKDIENLDEKIKNNEGKTDVWSMVKKPLDYVYIFGLTIIGLVLGNSIIFYTVSFVLVFLFLRFIKRRFIF
ncbi:MAG: Uncharacterized protein LiPW30_502 [Parcubacteria group bacterium LiPW_30]|nr:MAG: Uncharacterized protein LiPW30_502 [Parcubacteria group bacterium LiPW_30]